MKAQTKNVLREIKKTKSRFISIMAIVALGVGFFSGIKATTPSMIHTAEKYFEENKLMDIRLMSSYGFDNEDIKAIKNTSGVKEVMASYTADVIESNDGGDSVIKVFSLCDTKNELNSELNIPIVTEGRLPNKSGECVIKDSNDTYNIGDKIKLYDSGDVEALAVLEFEVVGMVKSPQYISFDNGSSTIGNGSVSTFIFINPEDFAYERYTDVYITLKETQNIPCFSNEYDEIVSKYEDLFLNMGEVQCERFKEEILSNAQKEIDKAEQEYLQAKEDAEKQLTDAKKQIDDGEKEYNDKIAEAEKTISDGKKQLEDAKVQLVQGEKTYNDLIIDTQIKLEQAQKEIDKGWEEYESGKKQLEEGISSARQQYQEEYENFYFITKVEADKKLQQAEILLTIRKSSLDYLKQYLEYLESQENKNGTLIDLTKKQIEKSEQEYNTLLEEYNLGKQQLAEGELLLKQAKQKIDDEEKAGKDKLVEAEKKLRSAEKELADGKLKFETSKITGKQELEAARDEIEKAEQELVNGEKELEEQKVSGAEQIEQAKEEYETAKADAELQLADAEQQLNEAKEEISSVSSGKWYFFTRDYDSGYSGYSDDADRIDKIATVFPVFFLLVAALVCLTTMTRMVEEHRTEIGTLKAMGYSNFAIMKKFLVYATIACLVGCVVGIVMGTATLPYIIFNTYGLMYRLTDMALKLPWSSIFISSAVALLCTTFVVFATCNKSLSRKPSELMRPKAPKAGKKILLERIPFLWKCFGFTSKVTARNLFRYKARFLMTVIGIAGCTALVIAGFGLKDSIGVIVDRQFNEVSHNNTSIIFKNSGTAENKTNILKKLQSDDRLSDTLLVRECNIKISTTSKKDTMDIYMFVPENMDTFKTMITTKDIKTGDILTLSDDSVFITNRVADVYNLSVGDVIDFVDNNESYSVKVGGIVENYVYNYMYISPTLYEKLTGSDVMYTMALSIMKNDTVSVQRQFAEQYLRRNDILSIQYSSNIISSFNKMIKSLNIIVVVLVLCAGILAFVVLYNLTNINLTERVREIATIKVLGFYNREVSSYVYRENIVLTILGIIFGVLLGIVLQGFIVNTIQMDMVTFPKLITASSYVFSIMITALFAVIVNIFMYFKMKKIDMVESLKSIE